MGDSITNRRCSLVRIHSGVFLFGLVGVFAKVINLPAMVIVFGRVFFASISLFIFSFILGYKLRLKFRRDHFSLIGLGLLLSLHWSSFFISVKLSSVAIAVLSFSTFPAFTSFFEPLLFDEKFKLKSLVISMIALIGVVIVMYPPDLKNNATIGALWGLCSGFTFALLSVFNRKLVKRYSGYVVAFYQDFWATVVLFPFLFVFNYCLEVQDILLLILLGVVFTGLAHSLFIEGFKNVSAHSASVIALLEPVYGILGGVILLKEIPTPSVWLGGAVILGVSLYETLIG